MTVTRKPDRRRERGISRKAIAQGMPDRFGEPVVYLLVCFLLLRTRLRASQTPGIPCSLWFAEWCDDAKPEHDVLREGKGMSSILVWPILRDARLRRAPQDEVNSRAKDPHGEEAHGAVANHEARAQQSGRRASRERRGTRERFALWRQRWPAYRENLLHFLVISALWG
jgi:hypothetical protein